MSHLFPNVVPFENRVMQFITEADPDAVIYTDDIARSLGIGLPAVTAAVASLELKGMLATQDEPEGGAA